MLAPLAEAAVSISSVFGANMVLQRGKAIPVSGTAAANKVITVTFNGQTKGATSDAAGKWQIALDPMAAKVTGGNLTAQEAGANTVTLGNVRVGDVWICGGQSNMDNVGERLALWALKNDYKRPIATASGPVLKDVTVSGGSLVCSFDHVGEGLMVGAKTAYLPTVEVAGGALDKSDPGMFIQDVTVDGVSVGSVRHFTFDPLDSNRGITATFAAAPPVHTITATASGGGSFSEVGAIPVAQGATRTFTVTPASGARVSLTVDGKVLGPRTRHTFADVRENHTIAASFTFPINAQAGYGGSIRPPGRSGPRLSPSRLQASLLP